MPHIQEQSAPPRVVAVTPEHHLDQFAWWRWFIVLAVLVAVGVGIWWNPQFANAQVADAETETAAPEFGETETIELAGAAVVISVQPGGEVDAAGFVEAHEALIAQSVTDLAALFGVDTPPTMTITVYHDDLAYNVVAEALPPSVLNELGATVDPAAGELAIYYPYFTQRTPLEIENVIRHGVARLLVAHVSNGNLPRGFSEGIAMYVERPVIPKHARYAATMSNASLRGGMLSWSDLNRDRPPTADADLIEAQSYAVVAFLIDRYGLRAFRNLVLTLADEPDWRPAMRGTYNRDPGEIERQWRENIGRWSSGDWRNNLVAAFDLAPAQAMIDRADYHGAKSRLEQSHRLFTDLGDHERLVETDAMLTLCEVGIQAETLMTQAQQALERHTYDRARTLVVQARGQYDQLPSDHRPDGLLEEYERLATDGLTATQSLEDAQRRSRHWADYAAARSSAVAAGTVFASLGDAEMTARAESLIADLDNRQRRLVFLLGALAALTSAWLVLWLWARGPAELDWS